MVVALSLSFLVSLFVNRVTVHSVFGFDSHMIQSNIHKSSNVNSLEPVQEIEMERSKTANKS